MLTYVASAYTFICNLISPPFCAYCKNLIAERSVFCSDCFVKITPIVSQKLAITKTKSMTVYALSAYKNPLRYLILQKNRSDTLAAWQLGHLVAQHLPVENLKVDCIVPVPLHWTRYARRGYNQAEIIAQALGSKYKVPVLPLIKRVKRTPYQTLFKPDQRFTNVKDAFTVNQKFLKEFSGKNIIIVDDVLTSGATMQAVAKKLLAFKPNAVNAIVCCRVV